MAKTYQIAIDQWGKYYPTSNPILVAKSNNHLLVDTELRTFREAEQICITKNSEAK